MSKEIKRAHNFNAGPSALPLEVLRKAQKDLLDLSNTGMSVMEMSHRSQEYVAIHDRAISLLKELLRIPEDYQILFLQGGASLQFSMIPLNFLIPDEKAGYIMTGSWSKKALTEAQLIGDTYQVASSQESNYQYIPALEELKDTEDTAYIHLTSNNTIFGTQWQDFPDTGHIPLMADMSSDILCKPLDVSKFSLIYAGAQKNLGPAGTTIVIIKDSLLNKASTDLPTMLRYSTFADHNSLYNTPPTFGIYMIGLVLEWLKERGGLTKVYEDNLAKADLIYQVIDNSDGFYQGHARHDSRSIMNITFRLNDEDLEQKFLAEARTQGFVGLNGHRSVGGCRASIYNAVPYASCLALQEFMLKFKRQNS